MSQINIGRQITVSEMAPHIHSFSAGENKVNKLVDWLSGWIKKSLSNGLIKPYDFLPQKGTLACHIGVSLGTMQSVFRYLEDLGLVESKQKLGTFIKNPKDNSIIKLTSRREMACAKLKQHILESYSVGDNIISIRKLSNIIGISNSTIKMALNTLESENIIKKYGKTFIVNNLDFKSENITTKTLTEKISDKIQEFIKTELQEGAQLPSNPKLAKKYNVSIKTINDAIKHLIKIGVVTTRRGQYGTVVINSDTTSLYDYEKIELKLKKYISEELRIGDKLPPIKELSNMYSVSPKTISKAFDNLKEDGFIMSSRGRNGGTYITDIPQKVQEAYTWLAINPAYIDKNDN